MNIVVKQNDKSSCAVACALSIIRYYGGNIAYLELEMILNTTKFGTNALDLINGMKTIGFDGRGINMSFEELTKYNLTHPIIAHIIQDKLYHFVVIYKIDSSNQMFVIMNPSKGIENISFENFKKIYLNTVIDLFPVNEIPNIKPQINYSKWLKNFLKINKKIIFIIVISSLLVIFLSYGYTYLFKDIYKSRNYINIFLMLLAFKYVFIYIKTFNTIKLEKHIGINLMKFTFDHLFKLPNKYLKNKSIGDVAERIREIENIKNKLIAIIISVIIDVLFIITTMIIFININLKIFILMSIFIIFSAIYVLLYKVFVMKYIEKTKEYLGRYESYVNESLKNYITIKNLNVEKEIKDELLKKYIEFSKVFKKLKTKVMNIEILKQISIDTFTIIFIFISLFVLKKDYILFLISLLSLFIDPIQELSTYFIDYFDFKISIKRINDIFILREEESNLKENLKGNIKFNDVAYKTIFKNINFDISCGSMFLLYGESGIGKSTLLKILTKEITDFKGSIYIGKENFNNISKDILDNSICYVTQEEHLFNDTIENNIKLYRNLDNEHYNKILKLTHVDKIIEKRDKNNNFWIYEDGFNLSGGDRQKIILARALVKQANIYIFDESLSQVGVEEEKDIIKNIRNHFIDKTIIYITHKKDMIDMFKYKYEMKGGVI